MECQRQGMDHATVGEEVIEFAIVLAITPNGIQAMVVKTPCNACHTAEIFHHVHRAARRRHKNNHFKKLVADLRETHAAKPPVL